MKKLTFLIAAGSAFFALSCNPVEKNTTPSYNRANSIESADTALELLVDGNNRFVAGTVLTDDVSLSKRQTLSTKGQKPFAVIVTCSDSRVPPELVFDQGLGDLFIIRVAGNVIDSVGMGSIQYAVEHLHVPLVVVLGHEKCGAVHATIAGGELPGSLPSIAQRIQPSVDKVKTEHGESHSNDDLVIEANVDANVEILNNDVLLKHMIETGAVKALGAVYQLETGLVKFTDAKQTSTHH